MLQDECLLFTLSSDKQCLIVEIQLMLYQGFPTCGTCTTGGTQQNVSGTQTKIMLIVLGIFRLKRGDLVVRDSTDC